MTFLEVFIYSLLIGYVGSGSLVWMYIRDLKSMNHHQMYSAKTREEVKEGVYYLVLMPIVPMIGAGVIYCWLIIWILIKIIRNINNFIDNKIDSLRIIDQDKEKMSDPDWDPLRDIINRSDSEYNQYEL